MDHHLLISELQALVVESRRRHPEVKEAGEHALAILREGPPLARAKLAARAEELLAPVQLGCRTRVAKVVGISIAALQRLVSLGGVPTAKLPEVLQTLNGVANQAVDIQLKLLQTLLSIMTHNKDMHDDVLGSALLLCFKLQESRVSVVSSTAAATLRQAVMLVFDRISSSSSASTSSSALAPSTSETDSLSITLPTDPPTDIQLSPSARDAYYILSDLCLLTASAGSSGGGMMGMFGGGEKEKPKLLKLGGLQRTFGLELVESILSGYQEAVKGRPELLHLLKHSLTPLLLKLQAEKPSFPIALRVCRLIFLLVRSFSEQLPGEVEVFFLLLLRLGTGDVEHGEEAMKKADAPPYLRVLALESLRGISGDPLLLQTLYERYDARTGSSAKLFTRLVAALSKLLNEKPALLGVSDQMRGLGVPTDASNHSGYFDVGLNIVSAAASAGVNTVSSMMGGDKGAGLGTQSGLKQRLIEQHDKAEAPPIPDTYPYLLAIQSLDAIAEGIYHVAAQTQTQPSATVLTHMADSAWPALLAALAYATATNLSEPLFAEVLSAFHDFTIACGLLQLDAPRDAFLATLGKYAVPPPAVSAMQAYNDSGPSGGRSVSATGAEALGLVSLGVGSGHAVPPSLSERNMACLKSVVSIARTLSGSLGSAWHDVLEVLQNANFMLARRPGPARRPTVASPNLSATPSLGPRLSFDGSVTDAERPDVFADLDADAIQANINVLFDGTRDMSDQAFSTFVSALCRLSSEMIGTETGGSHLLAHSANPSQDGIDGLPPASPRSPSALFSPNDNRRRTSGIQISASIKSGERSFSLGKLRQIATLNLARIVTGQSGGGWDAVTRHLLDVARHASAPSTIRMQACETLDEILLAAMRIGKEARVQHQVFDVLIRQVDVAPISSTVSTDYDVRSAGYHTLNQILESSGHSLEVGWKTIFEMLNWVCKVPARALVDGVVASSSAMSRTDSSASDASAATATATQRPTASMFSKGDVNLVRIAFPSLNLICTDFLSSLDAAAMRLCIGSLGCFGRQREDVNIALSSIGLLWNVSDAVQGTTRDSELWLFLLLELLELARDPRSEVCTGAMQTLFRCVELYGSTLDATMWRNVLDRIVFPLVESADGDEGQVLALSSIGSIFAMFYDQLVVLEGFAGIWTRLLARFERAFETAPRSCATAAVKAVERVVQAVVDKRRRSAQETLLAVWRSFDAMGRAIQTLDESYTQDNLVAYVRVATLLHQHLEWDAGRLQRFSDILRAVVEYARSPDYRHDIDSMSPLQQAVAELVAGSKVMPVTTVLGDLAAFSTLAYVGAGESSAVGKRTYIALSKYAMGKLGSVFGRAAVRAGAAELFAGGTETDTDTMTDVLSAYAIPIKLKYDCPPANKFGKDRPLWQTALSNYVAVLEHVMRAWTRLPEGKREGVWGVVMDVFAGVLLADAAPPDPAGGKNAAAEEGTETVETDEDFILPLLHRMRDAMLPVIEAEAPERVRAAFAEALAKASVLYRFDAVLEDGPGGRRGTTAREVGLEGERVRYWALDLLVRCARAVDGEGAVAGTTPGAEMGAKEDTEREQGWMLARTCAPVLLQRFTGVLRAHERDAALRGMMPFPQIREDELLYVLRHVVTLRIAGSTLDAPSKATPAMREAIHSTSRRAHLFHLYPFLLRLSFSTRPTPSMWLLPSEHCELFEIAEEGERADGRVANANADANGGEEWDAGDGAALIEVSARDLARRALELVGDEVGLGDGHEAV